MAQQTGVSQSRVHRHKQAMERRDIPPASWLWETEAGRTWCMRLVVGTLSTFGCKRGVGAATMRESFVRLHRQEPVGCSPNALRGVMQRLESLLVETAQTWETEASAPGEVREILGAVDETWLAYMRLVLMDLHRGDRLLEDVAEDRPSTPWKVLVDQRLDTLPGGVRSLVSDRAKTLMQLAEKGFGGLSIPDFFPLLPERINSYALSMGRRLKQSPKALETAAAGLEKAQRRSPEGDANALAIGAVEVFRQEVRRWAGVLSTSRHHLLRLSLARHPCDSDASTVQSSTPVGLRVHAEVAVSEACVRAPQPPARPEAIHPVNTQ